MFRITEDPSSGRLVQCLAKNYTTDSIVSHDTDMVSFMAVYCDRLCVCLCVCVRACVRSSLYRKTAIGSAFLYTELHTHTQNGPEYAAIRLTMSVDTDMVSLMAAYCDRLCVCVCACVVHFIGRLPLAVPSYTLNYTHTHTTGQNMLP